MLKHRPERRPGRCALNLRLGRAAQAVVQACLERRAQLGRAVVLAIGPRYVFLSQAFVGRLLLLLLCRRWLCGQ